jgi:hypothetical protein
MNTYHPKSESLREQLAALPRATIDATLHIVREGDPEGLRQWIGDHPEKCEAIRQLLLERRRVGKWPASLGEPEDYFWETASTPTTLPRAGTNGHDYAAVIAKPWPVMDDAAYHGLAGDVARTIEPHSEADPVALLIQLLTLAGNVIGSSPYYQVESDRHHANLFAVLVGESAKARKGTALGRIRSVVKVADETWNGLKGGLSSGEGLIYEVRDPAQKWDPKAQEFEVVDAGASDKRLAVIEPEFASVLAVSERLGNTLSQLIRRAWDGDKLETLTKNSPLCATGAHISVVGHVTQDEVRARLTQTDRANGFANRFLLPYRTKPGSLVIPTRVTPKTILTTKVPPFRSFMSYLTRAHRNPFCGSRAIRQKRY